MPRADDDGAGSAAGQIIGAGGFDGGIGQRLAVMRADIFDGVELALYVVDRHEPPGCLE